MEHLPILSNRVEAKLLDRVDGMDIAFMRTQMPPMISNRVIIATAMQLEMEDGSLVTVRSSIGNEEYAKELANDIYWDVLALQPYSMTKFTQEEGGCRLTQVFTFDPMGWLPEFIV